MAAISLPEFADKINEIMPVIMREFIKQQTAAFYKEKITLPQFIILDVLNRQGRLHMSELAGIMNVTTAAMTGIIDRLVRDGYLERIPDPRDRRIIRVRLTARGNKVVKNVSQRRRQTIINVFGRITQAERENYLNILMHIRDHLK